MHRIDTNGEPANRHDRARRKLLAVAVLVAFPAALLFGVWVWLDYRSETRLQTGLRAMGQDGLLLPLSELMPERAGSGGDAAPTCGRAFAASIEFVAGLTPRQRRALEAYGLPENDPPAAYSHPQSPSDRDLRSAARPILQQADARQTLWLLEVASREERCVPAATEHELAVRRPQPDPGSDVATVLMCAWIRLALDCGDDREALRRTDTALALTHHVLSVPSTSGHREGAEMALRLLACVRALATERALSPDERAQLDRLLVATDRAQVASALIIPRVDVARRVAFFDLVRRDPGAVQEALDAVWYSGQLRWGARLYCSSIARPLQRVDELRYLSTMRSVLAISSLPYRDSRGAYQVIGARLLGVPANPFIAELTNVGASRRNLGDWEHWPWLCAHYDVLAVRRDSLSAAIGLTRLFLSLQAYAARRGRYPATLRALERSAGRRLPMDPFSGATFGYSPRGGGFRLYSIGPDLVDGKGEVPTRGDGPFDDGDIVLNWASS